MAHLLVCNRIGCFVFVIFTKCGPREEDETHKGAMTIVSKRRRENSAPSRASFPKALRYEANDWDRDRSKKGF
jgi:hypothetical protein